MMATDARMPMTETVARTSIRLMALIELRCVDFMLEQREFVLNKIGVGMCSIGPEYSPSPAFNEGVGFSLLSLVFQARHDRSPCLED